MTRTLSCTVALALGAAFMAPSVASAHDAVKAIVIMKPGVPRAGETCTVEVSVLTPPGLQLLDQIEGVRVIGEMTGHKMTPLEASLQPVPGTVGGYTGTFALSMGGPWEMTLRIKVANEEMWGPFPVEAVRADQSGDPVGMRYIIEMRDPIRTNILSPWLVVGWTLGLIVLLEGAAMARKIRVSRRRGVAATVSG